MNNNLFRYRFHCHCCVQPSHCFMLCILFLTANGSLLKGTHTQTDTHQQMHNTRVLAWKMSATKQNEKKTNKSKKKKKPKKNLFIFPFVISIANSNQSYQYYSFEKCFFVSLLFSACWSAGEGGKRNYISIQNHSQRLNITKSLWKWKSIQLNVHNSHFCCIRCWYYWLFYLPVCLYLCLSYSWHLQMTTLWQLNWIEIE